MLRSLAALTGWKAIGAISLLLGVAVLTVHALFEFLEWLGRRRRSRHPLLITLSHASPDCLASQEENRAVTAQRYALTSASVLGTVGAIALALGGGATGLGQRSFFAGDPRDPVVAKPTYDGRFTFARLKYTSGPGGYYYRGLPAWAHGYIPSVDGDRAEVNLMKIMNEVSYLNPHIEEGGVFSFDDPELFKYPLAYMSEPGFWTMGDQETAGLRAYLLKGGFIIFDDFRADGLVNSGGGWANFARNVRRAFPELQPIELDASAAVFHSFFGIDSLAIVPQSYDRGRPVFFGLFEDNDPKKRMMAIVNYNTDVSDFWEFSATGFRPTNESNQAYKLGVNYIMYGMTH